VVTRVYGRHGEGSAARHGARVIRKERARVRRRIKQFAGTSATSGLGAWMRTNPEPRAARDAYRRSSGHARPLYAIPRRNRFLDAGSSTRGMIRMERAPVSPRACAWAASRALKNRNPVGPCSKLRGRPPGTIRRKLGEVSRQAEPLYASLQARIRCPPVPPRVMRAAGALTRPALRQVYLWRLGFSTVPWLVHRHDRLYEQFQPSTRAEGAGAASDDHFGHRLRRVHS